MQVFKKDTVLSQPSIKHLKCRISSQHLVFILQDSSPCGKTADMSVQPLVSFELQPRSSVAYF